MVRGRPTGPAAIPTSWRGPLPDPSLRPSLATDGGYVKVPESVLLSGLPDLGVMAWAVLRLWADDQEVVTTYRALADALGMQDVPTKAAEKRLVRVIPPMIKARLISRRRDADNRMHYQAACPGEGRWAVLRREFDFPLLATGVLHPTTGQPMAVTTAHLTDFARWQLECGRRGWTATPTEALAERWGVSRRTVEMRRDALVATGLLRVTRRAGHTDLVWLGELFDAQWLVPTRPVNPVAVDQASRSGVAESGNFGPRVGPVGVAECGNFPLAECGNQVSQKVGTPYKEDLAEGLTDKDLADLGGASAAPPTSLTRELSEAAPQATPRSETNVDTSRQHRQAAGRMVARRQYLAGAPPHFRVAMIERIGRALDRGLAPQHFDRALDRVLEYANRDAHCELVRLALQQAWADQHAGMCASCGGDGNDHTSHCPQRTMADPDTADEDPEVIRAAILASLDQVRRTGTSDVAVPDDPLRRYLSHEVSPVLDWTHAQPEQLLQYLTCSIARTVASAVPRAREQALQKAWTWWRSRIPPQRRDVLDMAVMQLRNQLGSSDSTRKAS